MATAQGNANSAEAAILSRMIQPERDNLPSEAAEALLRLNFDRVDLDRMHELVVKNQDDALSNDELSELESYLRLSSLLDLMHAKARRSLKRRV